MRSGGANIWRGATEISSGNNDLSSRTEEQAAALEETAASMEQLTATVKLNAESARQAQPACGCRLQYGQPRRLAGGRCGHNHERHFGQLMEDVVTTMSGISDSSKKIAEITTVIRQHRLPDQYSGAERRGGSGPGRGAGAGLCGRGG